MRRVQSLASIVLLALVGILGAQGPIPGSAPMVDQVPVPAKAVDAAICPPAVPAAPAFWAEADYVLYWLKPVCFTVPGLSVGNPADAQPGVLGQPGTRLVQGDHKFEFKGANGVRVRLGAWLTEDRLLGVEAGGFVLEQVAATQSVTSDAAGSPALFLVFQNPDNSRAALPFSVPGVVAARSTAVGESRMWGTDANLLVHLDARRGPWTLHATALFGCRTLHLADRVTVSNRQSLVADPSVTAAGEATFSTRNQFVGAQVGSRFGLCHGPWRLDLTGKLALGETYLESEVAGGPLVRGSSVLPPLVPGPLLALPSNLGRSTSARITVVSECNLRLRWQVEEGVHLTLGYNVLHWNKILCPGDQMDGHVNTTQLPFRGPVVGAADPAPKFAFTDTFRQGVEAGLGFTF